MIIYPIYILCWCLCLLVAFILSVRKPYFKDDLGHYLRFLCEPWKAITFFIAAAGITLAAPYSGDPTWDYVDGAVISILTFVTAPWTVGAIFRSVKTKNNWSDVFIALCLMLFSTSWFYDAYIYWRDGTYPATWLANLIISPTFYIAGGLFWNLEHQEGNGLGFSFQRPAWYRENVSSSFRKLLWITLPFIGFAIYGVYWFIATS